MTALLSNTGLKNIFLFFALNLVEAELGNQIA
jgi:hypothetical protein